MENDKELNQDLPCIICDNVLVGTVCDDCMAGATDEWGRPYVEPKYYADELKKLVDQDYTDLGWVNGWPADTEFDYTDYVKVFSNRSGTQCLYANHDKKLMYSVDMGD